VSLAQASVDGDALRALRGRLLSKSFPRGAAVAVSLQSLSFGNVLGHQSVDVFIQAAFSTVIGRAKIKS